MASNCRAIGILRLAGAAARMLRGEIALTPNIPIIP
jgi:hypothetical protein